LKVISLIQPWASLIAVGEKKIETRSWKTNYRGPLLIHAGKKLDVTMCYKKSCIEALNKHNVSLTKGIPSGLIIAKCNLVDCIKIVSSESHHDIACLENGRDVFGNEFIFGDYTPGRYAWILEDFEMLPTPIPAKGQLGLWEFEY
jgi:hypothetical protein